MTKKLGGTWAPSHARFSPKSPDQNSEIAILFTIVEKPNNLRFTPSQFPWKGLQVTNFDLCLHIVMVTGKCTDVFRGIFFWFGRESWGGGGVRGRIFPWKNFSWDNANFCIICILHYLINKEKINMRSFFYWKWGAALKLKTRRNYCAYEGFTSS